MVFAACGIGISERGSVLAGNGRADSIERVGFASGLEQLEERAKSSGGRCPRQKRQDTRRWGQNKTLPGTGGGGG